MPQPIDPSPRPSPEGVPGPKEVFGQRTKGEVKAPQWTKEGDEVDTTHGRPPCTEATNKGEKDHETPIVVGLL